MTTSSYEAEARDFLMRNKIKMSITFKDREVNRLWDENTKRNRYTAYIRNTDTDEAMRVIFWDSIHNTVYNITPTCYDILACLTKYDPGSYGDFCSEFGLARNETDYKFWRACCDEWEKVRRVFGEGEMLEELREIS